MVMFCSWNVPFLLNAAVFLIATNREIPAWESINNSFHSSGRTEGTYWRVVLPDSCELSGYLVRRNAPLHDVQRQNLLYGSARLSANGKIAAIRDGLFPYTHIFLPCSYTEIVSYEYDDICRHKNFFYILVTFAKGLIDDNIC